MRENGTIGKVGAIFSSQTLRSDFLTLYIDSVELGFEHSALEKCEKCTYILCN